MTLTTLEALEKARGLIDRPDKWIKGDYEREGAYCALGAVIAAKGLEKYTLEIEDEDITLSAAFTTLLLEGAIHPDKELGYWGWEEVGAAAWNDALTHGEVLAGFDLAIARLKEETE